MIVSSKLKFRNRREPYAYDMTAQGGGIGTSYAFDAIDEDETKVKVKCSEEVWNKLANVQRDTLITATLDVANPKVAQGSELVIHTPAVAPARAS